MKLSRYAINLKPAPRGVPRSGPLPARQIRTDITLIGEALASMDLQNRVPSSETRSGVERDKRRSFGAFPLPGIGSSIILWFSAAQASLAKGTGNVVDPGSLVN